MHNVHTYILTKQISCDLIFKKILQGLRRCLNNPIVTELLTNGKRTIYTYTKWLQTYAHTDQFLVEMFQNHGLKEWISL